MVQLNERNTILKDLAVTEGQLDQWKREGHTEATWRNNHEYKAHCDWAKKRRDFIQMELDAALLPEKPRRMRKNTPPVQSHRVGHGMKSSQQIYAERFG